MRARPWNAIAAEMFGTFLFFFVGIGAGALSANIGLVGVALAHGLVLAVVVSSFGAISGGHFNPAVTFGIWIAGRLDSRRAIAYLIAQLIGGVLAAAAVGYVVSTPGAVASATPALGDGVDIARGIFTEAILTAVLLAAVFGTAVDPRAPRSIAGLGIGLAVAADILMGGALTGGAMNPARWFGPAVVSGSYDNAAVWIAGPFAGAAFVAIIYRLFFLPEADEQTGADV